MDVYGISRPPLGLDPTLLYIWILKNTNEYEYKWRYYFDYKNASAIRSHRTLPLSFFKVDRISCNEQDFTLGMPFFDFDLNETVSLEDIECGNLWYY